MTDLGVLAVIAAIAGIILGVVLVVLIGAVRSEAFTRRVGTWLESGTNWALGKLKKDPVEDLATQVVAFRDDSLEVARKNGGWAFLASALGKPVADSATRRICLVKSCLLRSRTSRSVR